MNKKKLLLITNGFPFGNSERGFILSEFNALRDNFDVYIIVRGSWTSLNEGEGINFDHVFCTGNKKLSIISTALQMFRISVYREIKRARKGCGVGLFIRRLSAILRYSARAEENQKIIEKIVRDEKIDIIYTYWCTQATLAAIRIKKKFSEIKVVTRFHGYDLYNERTEEGWQPFRQDIAGACDKLFFACEKGKSYYQCYWKYTAAEKCIVAYIGCPCMPMVSQSYRANLIVVSCSNLILLKRVSFIIEALSLLPSDIQVEWHHIGDGVERNKLEEQASRLLSRSNNIKWTFHGQIMNSAMSNLYQQIHPHVFITTTSSEGVPVSIQEAFAMGIPAIATKVGGIPELIIDGENGYLLPENPDIQQIADTITRFYRLSPEQKQIMGEKARKRWKEQFNAVDNANCFVQNLKKIL